MRSKARTPAPRNGLILRRSRRSVRALGNYSGLPYRHFRLANHIQVKVRRRLIPRTEGRLPETLARMGRWLKSRLKPVSLPSNVNAATGNTVDKKQVYDVFQ